MTTTPNGFPAWTRTSTHVEYGGHENKINVQGQGVVNPRTDVGAEAITRLAADMEAIARTASFMSGQITLNDTVPAVPTFQRVRMMTGVTETPYAGDTAPTGFPTGARDTTGQITVSFATSYEDAYGIAADFAPSDAMATAHGTVAIIPTVTVSGQDVIVYVAAQDGTPIADATVTLEVW